MIGGQMIVKKESLISFLRDCSTKNIYGIEEVIVPSKNKFSNNGDTFLTKLDSNIDIDLETERSIDPTADDRLL